MSDWVQEEAARQCEHLAIARASRQELAESCLRAGMAHEQEAIRRVEFERGKRAGLRAAAWRCDERANAWKPRGLVSGERKAEAEDCAADLRTLADSTPVTARKALPSEPGTGTPDCEWREDSDGVWFTACDEAFVFTEGGPVENKMRWCCYCGAALMAVAYDETPDSGQGD
uniref:Uncharacterized protein n=1 Tax=viral metagenome TaxID=1070528 RepID=A0A6M3JVJ2_9ZZZZ